MSHDGTGIVQGKSLILPYLDTVAECTYLKIDLVLNLSWEESHKYQYSKLYWRLENQDFSEDRVVCFRILRRETWERVIVALPKLPVGSRLYLRLDASGQSVGSLLLFSHKVLDPRTNTSFVALADYNAAKEKTRAMVLAAEANQYADLPNYPESLSIELTAGCNLTCGHCSSHGEPDVHNFHNRMKRFTPEAFSALADEVFPYLTSICLVGRGEPTLVSHALWEMVFAKARQYNVLVSMVTNGLLLTKRLRPEHLPWIDTIMLSIDGYTKETMAENRDGVSLESVVQAMRHFHDMRRSAKLARRPKLSVSFTLKRNNIAEFPAFIDAVAPFEPDIVYSRHLLVFFEKERSQTLLDVPEVANHFLAKAYENMERHRIAGDCPPIVSDVQNEGRCGDVDALTRSFEERRSGSETIWSDAHKGAISHLDSEIEAAVDSVVSDAVLMERMPIAPDQLGCRDDDAQGGSTPKDLAQDRCIYFHRTGVLMADQTVVTCARPYAASVGKVSLDQSFAEAWNSETFQSCRRSFGTDCEWTQCRECWYRESRYAGQRDSRADQTDYDRQTSKSNYDLKSWDFRDELENEVRDKSAKRTSITR